MAAQNGAIPGVNLLELPRVEDSTVFAPRQAAEQEGAHFLGPGFVVFLVEEFEFAQVVLVAQGVETLVVGEVGFPMVVDEPVGAARQDAEVVHGLGAALGRDAVKGDRGVAHHM